MKPAVLALLQCFGHALAGFGFPSDVIVLAVRWYLRFGLSSRDVELHRLLPLLLLQACGRWRGRDALSPPTARSPTARIWLAESVVPLDAHALGPPGRGLVVVLLVGTLFLRGDVGILQHLEGVAGRHQPAHAVGLLDHRTLACG